MEKLPIKTPEYILEIIKKYEIENEKTNEVKYKTLLLDISDYISTRTATLNMAVVIPMSVSDFKDYTNNTAIIKQLRLENEQLKQMIEKKNILNKIKKILGY